MIKRICTLAGVGLLAVLVAAPPAQAAFAGKNGKIAFTSDRNGTQDVWAMEADGSGQALVQSDGAEDFWPPYPAWSPDGREIAFTHDHRPVDNHQEDIFVMDAAGGNLRPATFNGIYFFGPTWSPDGGRIAFFSGGSIAVTTFPPSGPLVSIAPRGGDNYDQDPDWSPDGSLIAFSRFTFVGSGGEGQDYSTIDVADPTGGEARALTTADYGNGDGHPSISPDGRTVVFSRGLPRGDPPVGRRVDLYTVPIGGGTPTLLTDTPTFNESEPVWSPDGTKIAFSGVQQAPSDPQPYCGQGSPHLTCDVYVINADGTGRRQLTSSPGDDWQPSWQPIPGPKRSDYENAAQFCKAAHEFFGDEEFGKRYGTNGNAANAFGKCVSQSQ